MLDAKLIFDEKDVQIGKDVLTIGRTSENTVSFPNDSNVSRYHAEIELRGDEFWLIDLNSSNGTTVNGAKVEGEIFLNAGDKILFGGSSAAEFVVDDAAQPAKPDNTLDSGSTNSEIPELQRLNSEVGQLGQQGRSQLEYAAKNAAYDAARGSSGSTAPTSSSGSTVMIAGAVAGLAVVCAVAAGAFYMTRGSACTATAAIVRPEPGDTISTPVEVEVETLNAECVQRAIFTIDGDEVASAGPPTFAATIDPKDFPELADGVDHALSIVLIDNSGEKLPQSSSVFLAFETRSVTKPPESSAAKQGNSDPSKPTSQSKPSLLQINEMSKQLVKRFAGNFAYNLSNKQFLAEVQKTTVEYAQEGYSQRAAAFRDTINVAFVREQNIDAPFGFILAMSRSKFINGKQGNDEGIWRISSSLVNDNKYNGQCGNESLTDASQNCAAKATALYMKALIFGVFDGDLIYSAAAFGKSPQDAGVWRATLPKDRADLWNAVRTAPEREQLVRFFAAGIVAENPQAFGLTKDRPLSELYRVTM